MKKFNLIFLTLLIAGASVFFVYEYQKNQKEVDVWSLVPGNAILVYESFSTVPTFNDIINTAVWDNLNGIPFYAHLKSEFEILDSLTGKSGNLDKLLINQPFLLSLHITSRNEFDFLFYFKIRDINQNDMVNKVIHHFEDNPEFSKSDRNFLNQRIYEIKRNNSETMLSYFFHQDHFIASFTPFLIEDAIRNLDQKKKNNFISHNPFLEDVNKIQHDEGNIYLDFRRINYLVNAFAGSGNNQNLDQLESFCQSSFLDLTVKDEEILLNGVCYAPDSAQYYLNVIKSQEPVAFSFKHLVPNRTAIFYHHTFSNPMEWQSSLERYWQSSNPQVIQKRLEFTNKYDVDFRNLLQWMEEEVGYAIMESIDVEHPDELIFIKTKDINEGYNQLTRLAERLNAANEDTLYQEKYGDFLFKQLNHPDLPVLLFGEKFTGFETSFFTAFENYIVIGNNITVLKSLIADIENEDVWSKSIRENAFLEKMMDKANFTMIVDTEKSWNVLNHQLDPKWRQFFNRYGSHFKRFENAAIQFSHLDNRVFTNITLQHQKSAPKTRQPQQYAFEQEVFTDAPIITKPWVVRNHIDRTFEVIVQDSLNRMYLISSKGDILWKKTLRDPIISELYQVDFFANGNLQYLFATDHALHIYDRNGNAVENYPLDLPDSIQVDKLSLIDYDNSKRYRFLISDKKGRLWMFNKQQENLDGWDPNQELDNQVAYPVRHIRVRGKDCMVAVEKTGTLHVLNRRGNPYDGFPVNLNAAVRSPIFIDIGNNFDQTYFTTIDQNGMMAQFNLNGETTDNKQLYKSSKESEFFLTIDALERTYIIVRQDFNRLSMLDKQGEIIFEKDYITSDDLAVQYYYFGADNEIFAVTDKIQEFTYIYNRKGELINYQPIESGFQIGLIYSGRNNNYKVYNCYQNRFAILSFAESIL